MKNKLIWNLVITFLSCTIMQAQIYDMLDREIKSAIDFLSNSKEVDYYYDPIDNDRDNVHQEGNLKHYFPNKPFSYKGVTVNLIAKGYEQNYRLDTKNWIMEIDYNHATLKPTYFDLNSLRTHEPEANRYLCVNLVEIGGFSVFGVENLFGGSIVNPAISRIIEAVFGLYENPPTEDFNPLLFPIANWAFIYAFTREQRFENDNYIKEMKDGLTIYKDKQNTERSIAYDELLRPAYINSNDGFVSFKYENHNLSSKLPPCSEYVTGVLMKMLLASHK